MVLNCMYFNVLSPCLCCHSFSNQDDNYKTDGLNLVLFNFLNEFAGVHKRIRSPTETFMLKVKYAVKTYGA